MNGNTMIRRAAALCAAVGFAMGAQAVPPYAFLRVAPNGDDAAAGTAEAPLKTFAGAQARIREMKAKAGGALRQSVIVEFADGAYAVDDPIAFGAADSGTPDHAIVYRALNRGKAVVSGAVRLDWQAPAKDDPLLQRIPAQVRGKILVATVPGTKPLPGFKGGKEFANDCPYWLFAADHRLPVAGWPDMQSDMLRLGESYDVIPQRNYDADLVARNAADKVHVAFASDAPRLGSWVGEPDPWAFGFWGIEWDDAISPMTVDAARREATLERKSICYPPKAGSAYRVLNVFAELDKPGEWAIDRSSRRIYLLPEDGARPICAASGRLMVAKGLSDVTFDGFTFAFCRETAVDMWGCRAVTLRGCTVRNTVSWGICVNGGSDCRVEGCDLYRIGEGAVVFNGGDRATLTPARHVAVNNHIHHYGEVLASYRAGIALGRQAPTVGCRAEHNLVHHAPHQGISFCGNDSYVGYNVIHDTCLWSADAGPIYSYVESDWTDVRGSVVERNVVAMNGRKRCIKMIYDIYVDGIVSGVTVRDNLTVGGTIGIFAQGGHANVQERNLVVMAPKPQVRNDLGERINHTRPDSPACNDLFRNRKLYESGLWRDRFPEVARMIAMEDRVWMQHAHFTVVRDNLYVLGGAPENQNYEKLAATSVLTNNVSVQEDPGFVDWARLDWRLKPGSLAYGKLGPNRFEEIGLYEDRFRASPAVKFGKGFAAPREMKIDPHMVWGGPHARLDVNLAGTWSKENPCASNVVACSVASWAKYGRLVTGWDIMKGNGQWTEYSFSFTPNGDTTMSFELMGAKGEKTYYDDVRVTGATVLNGDFEQEGSWRQGAMTFLDICSDVSDPTGIAAAPEGLAGKPGNRVGIANHARTLHQGNIKVKKGQRVTITFKAAGLVK